jgi:uncharacterized protein YraI
MNTADFVALVERNAARVTVYKNGGDGSGGKCDCIGLIIGAVRLGGLKWPGTHGSNYAARYQTTGLAADQPLRLGDLVYKAREPGASGYKLPDAYKNHADRRDYYHVGVVTCASPLRITHCTSVPGGIKVDTARGKWKYSGRLRLLDQEAPVANKQMTVYAANGKTVNLRSGPGTEYPLITAVPIGTVVTETMESNGWAYIQYGGKQGYMMEKFLAEYTPEPEPEPSVDIDAALRYLLSAQANIDKALEILNAKG